MPFDLAPEKVEADRTALANLIRFPDTEAASAAAASMKLQDTSYTPQTSAEMLDKVKQVIQSGGELSAEQRAFYEQASAELNPPAAELKEPEAKPDPNAEHTAKIDAITAKLEAKQPLTLDEEKYVASLDVTPVIPDKTYKIGGQEFTAAQMLEKAAADIGVTTESLSPLGAESIGKIIDNYVTKANKHEWSQAMTGRDQELARQRRQVGVIASRLMADAQTIQNDLQRASDAVKQAEMFAGKQINPDDIYTEDGKLDILKQREVNKVLDAREKLPELKQTIQVLQERSVQTEQQLAAQRFRDFQEAHPQYRTGIDIVDAVVAMREGRLEGDDLMKTIEVVDIMRAAGASNIHPDDVFEYRKNARQLSVTPATVAQTQRGTDPPRFARDNSATEEVLKRLRQKREQFSGAAGGGGAVRVAPQSKSQQAAGTIAASARMAIGVAGHNDKLSEAGF